MTCSSCSLPCVVTVVLVHRKVEWHLCRGCAALAQVRNKR
jgi:hypothetical protein